MNAELLDIGIFILDSRPLLYVSKLFLNTFVGAKLLGLDFCLCYF
jgi:hypothetical protein